jgi:hypothetical protein
MLGRSELVGLVLAACTLVSQVADARAFGVAPELTVAAAADLAEYRGSIRYSASWWEGFRPDSSYEFDLDWPEPKLSPAKREGLGERRYRPVTAVVASLEAGDPGVRSTKKRHADSVVEVILNEMVGSAMVGSVHAMQDAIFIASVIANRAVSAGLAPHQIVSVQREFNGYGIPLRRGAEKDLVLARKALEYVARYGPVHDAMYYATPEWTDNLPEGLERVAQTAGHVYFSDPEARSYRTTQGFVRPDRHVTFEFWLTLLTCDAPIPTPRPRVSMNHRFR